MAFSAAWIAIPTYNLLQSDPARQKCQLFLSGCTPQQRQNPQKTEEDKRTARRERLTSPQQNPKDQPFQRIEPILSRRGRALKRLKTKKRQKVEVEAVKVAKEKRGDRAAHALILKIEQVAIPKEVVDQNGRTGPKHRQWGVVQKERNAEQNAGNILGS